jgi:hypothetical protein
MTYFISYHICTGTTNRFLIEWTLLIRAFGKLATRSRTSTSTLIHSSSILVLLPCDDPEEEKTAKKLKLTTTSTIYLQRTSSISSQQQPAAMTSTLRLVLLFGTLSAWISRTTQAFQISRHYEQQQHHHLSSALVVRPTTTTSRVILHAKKKDQQEEEAVLKKTSQQGVEEYRNAVTKVLSNFMQKESMEANADDLLAEIDFKAPKIPATTSLETLAAALDCELIEKQWFVTGNVNPSYFSDEFEFQDPDVQLKGIEEYARGVNKLFDQSISEAQIISTVVNDSASTPEKPMLTVTWRLSGGVNIGFGLKIKPYIVYTDFVIDPKTSLIVFQEDRFDSPPWDILLR